MPALRRRKLRLHRLVRLPRRPARAPLPQLQPQLAPPVRQKAPRVQPWSLTSTWRPFSPNLAGQNKEKLDWRSSIVDLMKLLDLDSSLSARKELAKELNYTGDMNDSARMNVWLHKQVMIKLAENGGKVPDSLKG